MKIAIRAHAAIIPIPDHPKDHRKAVHATGKNEFKF
jgi:hypothetical protein